MKRVGIIFAIIILNVLGVLFFIKFNPFTRTVLKLDAPSVEHKTVTKQVKLGKDVWESNKCMDCHELLGEGSVIASDLSKISKTKEDAYIREALLTKEKCKTKANLDDKEIEELLSFFEWVGDINLNGFE